MNAGDLISELALAIEMGSEAVDIALTIHPHPTLGESVGMAAEAYEGVCNDFTDFELGHTEPKPLRRSRSMARKNKG